MDYPGKLILFTSFYKQQTIFPYVESLLSTALVLERIGVKFDYWPRSGDFHAERAINFALSRFAESEDATDFLNIDSDESWDPTAVVKLLVRPEPIICGTYKCTNSWDDYVGILVQDQDGDLVGKLTGENAAILKADKVPAGFLRIKKEAVRKYIETYPEDYYWESGEKSWRFFWNDLDEHHRFISMDYSFSEKMKAIGFDLWIDPQLEIHHWGISQYKGNLDKYLRALKELKNAKELVHGIWAVQNNGRV